MTRMWQDVEGTIPATEPGQRVARVDSDGEAMIQRESGRRPVVGSELDRLRAENEALKAIRAEQAQEIERLESLGRIEKNYWKQVGMNYEKRKQAMQKIIDGQQKQIEGLASFHQSEAALTAKE